MKAAPRKTLSDLARVHGLQTDYVSMSGERQESASDAVIATLEALGIAAQSEREIQQSFQKWEERQWTRCLEPVIVAWDQRPTKIEIRLPSGAENTAHCTLQLEGGKEKSISLDRAWKTVLQTATINRRNFLALQLTLPKTPFGYHRVKLDFGNERAEALLISAPTQSYSEGRTREWGLFLPMYAARSRTNWGAGNFSDWEKLCDWMASLGGKIAGTLPLLAAFLDFPTCDPSPYSPASRLFWNEFYLDVTRIPEFAECAEAQTLFHSAAFQKQLKQFRAAPRVDYKSEWAARRKILELLARDFFALPGKRQLELEQFLCERPEAEDYAEFRAACDQSKLSWHSWPERLRGGSLRSSDFNPADKNFHLYIQWQAQQQIDALIRHCRKAGVQFYLDLPLGVHPDGYDVWRDRDCFALKASAGAPPDMFFTKGQNWGFAPLHPERIREQGYRYVLEYLRFQMRHTGLLRIDHVMGLHRLYWIPKGFSPADGVYVSYRAEELHAILSLESHRHKTMLVGENLGTVPPQVNESMKRHAMREMFVLQYDQQPDPKAALRTPPTKSVASLNTHDMPTFAAHWNGLEIADHVALGLVKKSQVKAKRADRKKLNAALAKFLKSAGVLKGKADYRRVLHASLKWLGKSPAEIVLVSLEDLLLEKSPQNVPGTHRERPNWQRKTKRTLEQIFKQLELRKALRDLRK